MSQDGGNVGVSSDQVHNAVSGLVDREKNLLANLDAVASSIMTAADYLAILKDSAQVGTYKELILNLGKLAHEVKAHQGVLQTLGQTYQASLANTDFKALLDEALDDSLQREPYKPQADARFMEFLELVGGAAGDAGGPGVDGDGGLKEDEDVRVTRFLMNDKCPLCMKEVFDLERPVKDHMGYVYEHASIMEYLRGHRDGHKHPCAGVTGQLKASDLKPADDVMRAKRRRRLMELMGGGNAQGGAGGSGGGGREAEFIDV